ncbi:hypothetical protein GGC47_004612 [Bosea sp. OAE752]|uniref:hypothetical protein n=1 Tax=Bosea sp. OAE752 TaxID=2663873 RepID=UPI003D1EBA37
MHGGDGSALANDGDQSRRHGSYRAGATLAPLETGLISSSSGTALTGAGLLERYALTEGDMLAQVTIIAALLIAGTIAFVMAATSSGSRKRWPR